MSCLKTPKFKFYLEPIYNLFLLVLSNLGALCLECVLEDWQSPSSRWEDGAVWPPRGLQRGAGRGLRVSATPWICSHTSSGGSHAAGRASGPRVRKKCWMQIRREQGQAGDCLTPLLPSITSPDSQRTSESNGCSSLCMFLFGPTLTWNHTGKGMLGNVVLSLTKATQHNLSDSLN